MATSWVGNSLSITPWFTKEVWLWDQYPVVSPRAQGHCECDLTRDWCKGVHGKQRPAQLRRMLPPFPGVLSCAVGSQTTGVSLASSQKRTQRWLEKERASDTLRRSLSSCSVPGIVLRSETRTLSNTRLSSWRWVTQMLLISAKFSEAYSQCLGAEDGATGCVGGFM